MARLGIDDTFATETTAADFFRKLIVLGKKEKKSSVGKLLVVDSGKGGSGVTSIVATMGEIFRAQGKRVCLIDLDTETQDLTRFLLIRPTINENLTVILDGEKTAVKELLEQTYAAIDEDPDFVCVSPPVHNLFTEDSRAAMIRSFISVIEQLDASFDVVIVDVAGLRGALHSALQKIADRYFIIANPDIASVFATIQTVKSVLSRSLSTDDIRIVFNARTTNGVPVAMAVNEVIAATKLLKTNISSTLIPFCQSMLSWPASGESLLAGTRKAFAKVISDILRQSGFTIGIESALAPARIHTSVAALKHAMTKVRLLVSPPVIAKRSVDLTAIKTPLSILPPPAAAEPANMIEQPMISLPAIE